MARKILDFIFFLDENDYVNDNDSHPDKEMRIKKIAHANTAQRHLIMNDIVEIDSLKNIDNAYKYNTTPHSDLQTHTPPLVDKYQPDNCVYFSSPTRSILAKPPFASLLGTNTTNLSQRISESFRFAKELGHERSLIVGAIAFDTTKKSHLHLSTQFESEDVSNKTKAVAVENTSLLTDYRIQEVPDAEKFKTGVKEAISRFNKGELDKVVLSRTLEITCQQKTDIKTFVKRLQSSNSNGYTFAVKLQDDETSPARTLIGSSPELLISRQGSKIIANPLAGSEPRSTDPKVDEERAQQLLVSKKDRREHALVITAVVQALSPFCKNLHVPDEPSLINTPTMWHLSTLIEGELNDINTSSIDVALALHPTPAVCGFPREAAQKVIQDIEDYDRSLFTGMVGWCDNSGDGEWVVTIRCAEVQDHFIRLYAGAGIVAESSPEKELAETGAKFNTMLNALGIPQGNTL